MKTSHTYNELKLSLLGDFDVLLDQVRAIGEGRLQISLVGQHDRLVDRHARHLASTDRGLLSDHQEILCRLQRTAVQSGKSAIDN